jgi:hypothetical protein
VAYIPYERYHWKAITFPRPEPGGEQKSFDDMVCTLASSGVSTLIVNGRRGPIVVTWKKPK